jgi:hypothetical protein
MDILAAWTVANIDRFDDVPDDIASETEAAILRATLEELLEAAGPEKINQLMELRGIR